MKALYKGEAFSIDEILEMLQRQGLIIEDHSRAEHVLQNVSYTRLKNYLTALMEDRASHKFRPGTTFEDAYMLYGFDRRLRELIFHEIEKIEISIRTRIAYACNGSENGYWFLNPAYFRSDGRHSAILRRLKNELQRSDNEAILHFRKKYSNEFPPSWLTLEATSMGTLATIYDELKDEVLRNRISEYYGLDPATFCAWIWHLVAVRNDCAHHNRVWNRKPSSPAPLPQRTRNLFPDMQDEDRNHIYMTLCIIKYLQNSIKPNNTFAVRLKMLIGNFKLIDPALMGFPSGWEETEFWN